MFNIFFVKFINSIIDLFILIKTFFQYRLFSNIKFKYNFIINLYILFSIFHNIKTWLTLELILIK